MNIIIRNDTELQLFGEMFRLSVAVDPIKLGGEYYAKTIDDHKRIVREYAEVMYKRGHNHLLRLLENGDTAVSVALSLDIDTQGDKKVAFNHLSLVTMDLAQRKHHRTTDEIAHKLAKYIAGPVFKEVPHPGIMIPQIRHFLAPNEEATCKELSS